MPELTKVQTGFLEGQGQFEADAGTEAAPGITFGDSSTGIYKSATDEVAVTVSGAQKAKFTSDGIVGNVTGNVTGDLTGNVTGGLTVEQISASISDTAVDIFIYDTSKDSDGGAWRKRTQHTSWYNETLNTATRGSRREFPAVAVIVAESTQVTIYDGDDPDLPMWMVFDRASAAGWTPNDTNILGVSYSTFTSISMLNGIFAMGADADSGNNGVLIKVSFIEDTGYFHGVNSVSASYPAGGFGRYRGSIAERDSGKGHSNINDTDKIVNVHVNDVAMTVLPNAPIDSATGLPVPTIAVATDGGASVIKDDGSVLSRSHGYGDSMRIDIDGDLLLAVHNGRTGGQNAEVIDLVTLTQIGDGNASPIHADNSVGTNENDYGYGINNGANYMPFTLPNFGQPGDPIINGLDLYFGTSYLVHLHESRNSPANTMTNIIKSSYNTGWMHGDIKGAFLADTDATDVSADTLNSVNTFDGTFATSTGWTTNSDWTISGGVASCSGADAGRFIYPTTDRWPIGSSVVVEVTVTAYTSGTLYISYATGAATSGTNMTATGTYKFVNNVSGNDLIYFRSESFIGSIDNVKIYYAESDRSVNNKGLIPYGTITKTPVATGAELVAYGPFSSSNYLYQPYNTDFDFGTGDFSIMFWVKSTSTGYVFWRNDTTSAPYWDIYVQGTTDLRFRLGTTQENITSGVDTTQWTFGCLTRSGSTASVYINGKLSSTFTESSDITNFNAPLYIGRRVGSSSELTAGYVSLMRISGSAPSAEQIKKIYEDEKVLFQENAACTLYGSSDAVTALAYDEVTDRLHVGTSSGRSDFQGLRRINNTTTAVTTAISAHDEFIIEQ